MNSYIMAEKEKESISGDKTEPVEKIKAYNKLIKKLQNEREQIQSDIAKDYKEARRYVRSHPEEGVLIGFVGGIALGVLLGRLMK